MDITYRDIYLKLADKYKSPSQIARILTEDWVDNSVYCPNCGNFDIEKHPNNETKSTTFEIKSEKIECA